MTQSIGKRFLLAVDGSEYSMAGVEHAALMFPPAGKRMVLFHAAASIPDAFWDLEPSPYNRAANREATAWEAAQEAKLAQFMAAAEARLGEAGYSRESILELKRPIKVGVARDLAAEAGNGYEAVVIGRRGAGGLRELILGGVARKLTNLVENVSLILVDGPQEKNKILAALDGSPGSERVVDFLVENLKGSKAEILLFHVVRDLEAVGSAPLGGFVMRESPGAWIEDRLRHIRPKLEAARDRLLAAGFNPDKIKIQTATGKRSRAEAIIKEAEYGGYGVIALGRRGMSEVGEHAMGRVTDKTLQLVRRKALWIIA